jgi:hypothetical protein
MSPIIKHKMASASPPSLPFGPAKSHRLLVALTLLSSILTASPAILLGQGAAAQPLTTSACLSEWKRFDAAQQSGLHALLIKHRDNPSAASLSQPDQDRVKSYLRLMETIKFRCRTFVPPPPGISAP